MSKPIAVLVDGVRTPFVKAGTDFNDVPAQELGRIATDELLQRLDFSPEGIESAVFGCCAQPSDAVNIARVIALNSGIPKEVPAVTVHRNCASGMEAIVVAKHQIELGLQRAVIAGGVDSMSNIPLAFPKSYANFLSGLMRAKNPIAKLKMISTFKLNYLKPRITLLEALTDPFCGLNMGQTADLLAREWKISREEQDIYALASHQKWAAAQEEGKFTNEIVSVYPWPKYKKVIIEDIGPRPKQKIEQLRKLKPYFDRRYGRVTVGNSCQITDGAVATLVMEEAYAKEKGYEPLAIIRASAVAGIEPERMGLGPVIAAEKALDSAGLSLTDIGLMELNEAFAAQVLSVIKATASESFAKKYLKRDAALGTIDPNILNVNGGAIAMGHPVGASGARIVLTLGKEMKRRKVQFGLAFICIGGGQGAAVILERPKV